MLIFELYNRIMSYLFTLPLYMFHLLIIFNLCDSVLGAKEGRKKWYFWSMALIIFIFGCMPHDTNGIKYLIMLCLGIWLFRGGLAQKVCVISFGFFIWCYCLLAAAVYVLSFKSEFQNALILYEAVMVGAGNLLIAVVNRVIGDGCKEEDFGNDGWLFTGAIIINFMFMCWDIESFNLHQNPKFLNSWFLYISMMALLNVFLFIYYEKNILKRKQLKKITEFQKKNELEQAHYQRLEEIQADYRSLTHDMNRYLSILQAMKLDAENQGTQYELVEEIKARIRETSREIYCERPVLNAILNEKQNIAKENEIDFRIFVEAGFDVGNLDDFAMIGILSNLIDNAMEAAAKREDGKWIMVRMFAVNDGKQKFIRIENSKVYESGKKIRGFFTRKEDKKQHGFGLKNVQKLVEENHGVMKMKAEGERFTAELIFWENTKM